MPKPGNARSNRQACYAVADEALHAKRLAMTTLTYVFRKTFDGLEPVEETFTWDSDGNGNVPETSLVHMFGLGVKNACVDSMAGKMDDPVEARQALVEKIARIKSGDVKGANRGPRLSEDERMTRDILDGIIRQNVKGKMPKGDDLQKLRDTLMDRDDVKAFVAKKLAAAKKDVLKIDWAPPTA